jgi:hypothetical protein
LKIAPKSLEIALFSRRDRFLSEIYRLAAAEGRSGRRFTVEERHFSIAPRRCARSDRAERCLSAADDRCARVKHDPYARK